MFLSCKNNNPKHLNAQQQIDVQMSAGKLMPLNPDSVKSANYLIEVFNKEYNGLVQNDFESIQLVNTIKVHSLGWTEIYRITLSDSLPEVVKKNNYLLVDVSKQQGTIFLIDTLLPIRLSSNSSVYLISGIQMVKTKGYFILYDLKGYEFKEICNSMDLCENGLPVFNSSIECINYKPHRLSFKNEDINNDNILDISFSGTIAHYCKGLETGFGENDRPPLHEKNIRFSFLIRSKGDSIYECNFYDKDSICNLLE